MCASPPPRALQGDVAREGVGGSHVCEHSYFKNLINAAWVPHDRAPVVLDEQARAQIKDHLVPAVVAAPSEGVRKILAYDVTSARALIAHCCVCAGSR